MHSWLKQSACSQFFLDGLRSEFEDARNFGFHDAKTLLARHFVDISLNRRHLSNLVFLHLRGVNDHCFSLGKVGVNRLSKRVAIEDSDARLVFRNDRVHSFGLLLLVELQTTVQINE